MRSVATRAIKHGLLATGFYRRRLQRDRFPGVAVLCYHGVRDEVDGRGPVPFHPLHVRASELEGHCRLIREHCHPISVRDWIAADEGAAELPARPVVVTFDDGYRSVYTRAKPILEKYRVPAAVFVASAAVRTGGLFWHDRVALRFGEASVEEAKRLSYEAWREMEQRASDVPSSDELRALTPDQIGELGTHPMFDLGGHTISHLILARAEPGIQRLEIEENRRDLQAWAQKNVAAFAYPNGRPGIDYGSETVQLVREIGYRMAFSTRTGFATPSDSPFERPRFLMLAGITEGELAHRLVFSWRRATAR